MEFDLAAHDTLVANLLEQCDDGELIQTHISSIILTGSVAYKIKKPVDFGFLDYGTLEKRHHCCLEELRTNRRFAPRLYLGIEAITGSVDAPLIEGSDTVIEYAVAMRRFDQANQLDHVADAGALDRETIDRLAQTIARSHREAAPVAATDPYGEPDRAVAPMLENFDFFGGLEEDEALFGALADLKVWTLHRYSALQKRIVRRKAGGFVRECHGDMHLHNIAFFEGELILFDAIEFNPFLSHIDVISDLAFLVMDLEYRGMEAHARRLLSGYLEATGDYEGMGLLSFYKVYRALVRAKVEALRAAQHPAGPERDEILETVRRYVALAQSYTRPRSPFLALTFGPSASGKSVAALEVMERYGAVRVRSDVERMRLFGTVPGEGAARGIYSGDATRATYERLAEIAETLLRAGKSVVVDATFLKRWQRERFEIVAATSGVPLHILEMTCPETLLFERLWARREAGGDVSEADAAVLEAQRRGMEPLQPGEGDRRHTVDTASPERMRQSVAGLFG